MATKDIKQILFVEDEKDIRKLVTISLEKFGNFSVESCSSGQEALQRLQSYRPDLIILDVMMPIMDGPTTLQEIRRLPMLADVPVIFMTAKVQPHEIQALLELGVLGVISKPFNPITLAAEINGLCRSTELA